MMFRYQVMVWYTFVKHHFIGDTQFSSSMPLSLFGLSIQHWFTFFVKKVDVILTAIFTLIEVHWYSFWSIYSNRNGKSLELKAQVYISNTNVVQKFLIEIKVIAWIIVKNSIENRLHIRKQLYNLDNRNAFAWCQYLQNTILFFEISLKKLPKEHFGWC